MTEKSLPQEILDALANGSEMPRSDVKFDKNPHPDMTLSQAAEHQKYRNQFATQLLGVLTSDTFKRYPSHLQCKVTEFLIHVIQKNALLAIMDVASGYHNSTQKDKNPIKPSYDDCVIQTFASFYLHLGATKKEHVAVLDAYIKWEKENKQ